MDDFEEFWWLVPTISIILYTIVIFTIGYFTCHYNV